MATILVCDDHETVRVVFRSALEYDGHAVVEARDGTEAVALAERWRPDLVITDLVMPGLNGLDVLEVLRNSPVLETVPTVLMSGTQPLMDADTAATFGADAYLEKPFETTALLETVLELLPGGGGV
jgi:CheY-like chemotaxis protein